MIFIEKQKKTPHLLLKFIALQRSINIHPKYKDLDRQLLTELDDVLFQEQKGLCCYCMQKLPEESTLRKREHFLPQSKFKLDEVNYYNLYLVCTDDRSFEQKKIENTQGTNTGHCDDSEKAKGDKLISKYIGHPDCETFFHYNTKGEIIPRKVTYYDWDKWKGKEEGYTIQLFERDPEVAQILSTLYILNLNEDELVKKRKMIVDEVINKLPRLTSKQLCEYEIEKYQSFADKEPKPFAGVILYFLKQKLNTFK